VGELTISHLKPHASTFVRPPRVRDPVAGAVSRRGFLRRSAGAAGAAFAGTALLPALARAGGGAATAAPAPIPPNPDLFGFRINFPVEGNEPGTIFDLNGFVGVTEIQGTGTATWPDGSTRRLFFDVDNRFMTGEYVGLDGRLHHGTFGFV
jgi:hypothetical protein